MSKILVCDDDKAIVDAIEIYLSQEGYEIKRLMTERRQSRCWKRNSLICLLWM